MHRHTKYPSEGYDVKNKYCNLAYKQMLMDTCKDSQSEKTDLICLFIICWYSANLQYIIKLQYLKLQCYNPVREYRLLSYKALGLDPENNNFL